MSNMSYCRFENTYRDLQDCYEELNNTGSVEEAKKEAGDRDRAYIDRLISLCAQIVEEFGDIEQE